MAKAKSKAKKTTKAAAKVKTTKATPKVAKARSAPAVKARKKAAAPRPAAAPVATPAREPAPKPAPKPVQPESNWTDAIKAALERRHQQPDYPGAGSNSWKQRPKH